MTEPIFRVDEILKYSKGKSVLHFGYVQHSHLWEESLKQNDWAHAWIAAQAKRLVGVDYLRDEVEMIRQKYGYEGYFGDVTDLDKCQLNEKFDVVLCGELIEHLTNPGLMLEGIKRYMRDDSILIITTPNVWSDTYRKQYEKDSKEKWVNPEHVLWYSHFTLSNTLERHGYEEISYDYYFHFNTREKYFRVPSGPVGKLKHLYRTMKMNKSKKITQIGLFFVAKLSQKTPDKTPAERVKEFYQ